MKKMGEYSITRTIRKEIEKEINYSMTPFEKMAVKRILKKYVDELRENYTLNTNIKMNCTEKKIYGLLDLSMNQFNHAHPNSLDMNLKESLSKRIMWRLKKVIDYAKE